MKVVMQDDEIKELMNRHSFDGYEVNVYTLIDELVNSFESRTCDSCKYYKHNMETRRHKCIMLGILTKRDFSCSYWEKKDD